MKKHCAFVTLALALAPVGALANELMLSLPLGDDGTVIASRYQCSDKKDYAVRFVNSAPNYLALIEVNGETVVFVQAISASGARYVSGPYEFWTKGSEATFSNAMDDAATANCKVKAEG